MFNFLRNLMLSWFGKVPQAPPVANAIAGFGEIYQQHLLYHLFVLVSQSYKIKSDGGTDFMGIKWAPLKPSTIDNRFPRPIPGRVRGNLTKEQDKLWRRTFAQLYRWLEKKIGEKKAKSIASAVAWKTVKDAGAVTRRELYGNKKVAILIKTRRLYQSLAPGTLSGRGYRPDSSEQIAETNGNTVRIGSRVPYYERQNKTRPIIPPDNSPQFAKLLQEASDRAAVSAAKELERQKR